MNAHTQLYPYEYLRRPSRYTNKIDEVTTDAHNADTLTLMNAHTQLYSYEYIQRLRRYIIMIDEVTTGASISTGTSPTTESTNTIKS
jgi:hypothetical protein